MSDSPSDLDQLRRRIDEIDDRLQDLLVERVNVVSSVAAHKRSNSGVDFHQPAREAEILRRLAARSQAFPPATLVRMWREMLAATVRMQGSFTIAVYVAAETQGFWDIARDHYGSHTPMLAYGSTAQVIRAVTEGQAAVGVLPVPAEDESDPWWRHLLSSTENSPHVIARLPFGARGNARPDADDALAIGRGAQIATGRDRTLVATENAPDISRGRMFSLFSRLELNCSFMASNQQGDVANTLIELDGHVPLSDPRLRQLREELGAALARMLWLGGYAMPLSPTELGNGAAETRGNSR